MRVLLIDDELEIRECLGREALLVPDLELVTEWSVRLGLARAMVEPFDAVVVDDLSPGTHALDMLAKVGRAKPEVALVLLMAVDDRRVAERASQILVRIVAKPFDADHLWAAVGERIEQKRALAQMWLQAQVLHDFAISPPPAPFFAGSLTRAHLG